MQAIFFKLKIQAKPSTFWCTLGTEKQKMSIYNSSDRYLTKLPLTWVLRKWADGKNISICAAITSSSGRRNSINKRANNQLFYSTFG